MSAAARPEALPGSGAPPRPHLRPAFAFAVERFAQATRPRWTMQLTRPVVDVPDWLWLSIRNDLALRSRRALDLSGS